MTVHYTVTVEYGYDTIAGLRNRLTQNSGSIKSKVKVLRGFATDLRSILLGNTRAFVRTQAASACASQTVVCSNAGAVDDTDTLVVAGTTLSEKAVPSTESQYAKGATDATLVANLVACINAHSVLSKIVRAAAVNGTTFRITCKVPGPLGNLVTLTRAGVGLTLGGAVLASGAADANYGYSLGFTPST